MVHAKATSDHPRGSTAGIPGETDTGTEGVCQGVIEHIVLFEHESIRDLIVQPRTRPEMEVGQCRAREWIGIAEVIPANSEYQRKGLFSFPGVFRKKPVGHQGVLILSFAWLAGK